jgi:hypothetical protein
LQLTIGYLDNFNIEEEESQYLLPDLKAVLSDEMALFYEPIIYTGDHIFHDDGNSDRNATYPEGIYYRIVYDPPQQAYCIQYYVYWLMQNCTGFLGISNHKYDY